MDHDGIEATVVERSRLWLAFTMLSGIGGLVLLVREFGLSSPTSIAGVLLMFVGLPLLGWHSYTTPRQTAARLRSAPEGLVVTAKNRRWVIERGSYRNGTSYRDADGRHVVALDTFPIHGVRLHVADEAAARFVLAAVGHDHREGTTRFYVRRIALVQNVVSAIVIGLFLVVHRLVHVPAILTTLLLFATLAGLVVGALSNRVTLTVGIDGLDLKPVVGRRRFIPHARIIRVAAIPPAGGKTVSPGFAIAQSDTPEVIEIETLRERSRRGDAWNDDHVREAVVRAWSAALEGGGRAHTVAQHLRSADASTREWITRLRALGGGGQRADYRVPALDERALFHVVSDATAETELRAAAAVALGANREHAQRLRVVASDIADEKVRRVALAAVEAESEGLLEAELEPLNRRRMDRS